MSLSLETLMRSSLDATEQRSLSRELVSFLVIGTVAALAFIMVSSFAVGLGTRLPDWLVSALCYAAFVIPVYLAHRRFSFQSEARHAVAFPRYLMVQLSAICLVALFSHLCYTVLGIETGLASVVVLGLTAGVNFLVLRLWAFAHYAR